MEEYKGRDKLRFNSGERKWLRQEILREHMIFEPLSDTVQVDQVDNSRALDGS